MFQFMFHVERSGVGGKGGGESGLVNTFCSLASCDFDHMLCCTPCPPACARTSENDMYMYRILPRIV